MRVAILCLCVLFGLSAQSEISSKVQAGTIANGCLTQGNLIETQRSFDFAIAGEGWIPLQSGDSTVVYTRYGSFGMDTTGVMVHLPSGFALLATDSGGQLQKINLLSSASAIRKSFRSLLGASPP